MALLSGTEDGMTGLRGGPLDGGGGGDVYEESTLGSALNRFRGVKVRPWEMAESQDWWLPHLLAVSALHLACLWVATGG